MTDIKRINSEELKTVSGGIKVNDGADFDEVTKNLKEINDRVQNALGPENVLSLVINYAETETSPMARIDGIKHALDDLVIYWKSRLNSEEYDFILRYLTECLEKTEQQTDF